MTVRDSIFGKRGLPGWYCMPQCHSASLCSILGVLFLPLQARKGDSQFSQFCQSRPRLSRWLWILVEIGPQLWILSSLVELCQDMVDFNPRFEATPQELLDKIKVEAWSYSIFIGRAHAIMPQEDYSPHLEEIDLIVDRQKVDSNPAGRSDPQKYQTFSFSSGQCSSLLQPFLYVFQKFVLTPWQRTCLTSRYCMKGSKV